jgi:SAM-dependent methyltransferase
VTIHSGGTEPSSPITPTSSSEPIVNYFALASVGERYARGRPAYHPNAIRQIRERLELSQPVPRALDVGCGTGNSTRAVKDIAQLVVGSDASRGMLTSATPMANVYYVESCAEELPYLDNTFGLVTVASAFHWFDRTRFLPEARRVLIPSGWLAVYTTGSSGTMVENAAYATWNREVHRRRYPSPARHRRTLDEDDATNAGFDFAGRDTYRYVVVMTMDDLADYVTTQSNVIAAVERGTETLEEIRAWLLESLRPIFTQPRGSFPFEGTVTYLRKPA